MVEKTIGRGHDAVSQSMSFPRGAGFILDTFPEKCRLVRWQAYFVKPNVASFHVMREIGPLKYTTIHETKVDAEVLGMGAKEIAVTDDVTVEAGDRIGLRMREGALCVGYKDGVKREMLMKEGDAEVFTEKDLTYDFSIGAVYTT